ncbi:MAG: homocysteine S-methyltransferase family protein, partial [Bryobacteraceae bacterium]
MDQSQLRRQALEDSLNSRILVLDGAMGTMLQQKNPTLDDWGGARFENCSENLLFTRPEWIADVHRAYLKAGSDLI